MYPPWNLIMVEVILTGKWVGFGLILAGVYAESLALAR